MTKQKRIKGKIIQVGYKPDRLVKYAVENYPNTRQTNKTIRYAVRHGRETENLGESVLPSNLIDNTTLIIEGGSNALKKDLSDSILQSYLFLDGHTLPNKRTGRSRWQDEGFSYSVTPGGLRYLLEELGDFASKEVRDLIANTGMRLNVEETIEVNEESLYPTYPPQFMCSLEEIPKRLSFDEDSFRYFSGKNPFLNETELEEFIARCKEQNTLLGDQNSWNKIGGTIGWIPAAEEAYKKFEEYCGSKVQIRVGYGADWEWYILKRSMRGKNNALKKYIPSKKARMLSEKGLVRKILSKI